MNDTDLPQCDCCGRHVKHLHHGEVTGIETFYCCACGYHEDCFEEDDEELRFETETNA